MKNLKKYRHSQFLAILFLVSGSLVAQTQHKVKKSYPLNADATINVDAQHTKLVFETWSKNELEIEAFMDTKGLSHEEITSSLARWQLSAKGDKNKMNISSGGGFSAMPVMPRMDSIAMMTSEIIGPIMNELVGPMMQSFSQHPPLPPQFMENVGNLKFDHEAYKKDGEKYLKKWEKEMESKFGPEFEATMETWAKNFEKDAAKWSAKMEGEMEVWGAKFEKDMEKWAQEFEVNMEKWGEQFGAEMEKAAQQIEQSEKGKMHSKKMTTVSHADSKGRRTLIVRLPKGAKITLNVRYGEVNLAEKTIDLKAEISHSSLSANMVSGNKTKIDVSYSPVKIKSWEYGVLNTSYVPHASIEKVRSLKLVSASSDVRIGEIAETAVISGTFGKLDILKLDPKFKSLDINLENSDLDLNIPETALNFNYTGSQSSIKYPSSIQAKPVKSYDSELINGYQKSANGAGIVIIKARFSEVTVD